VSAAAGPISGLARYVIGRRRPSPSACCAATAAFASVHVAEIVADCAAAISSLVSVSGEDVPLMQG
jgi:hypothetical protein